METVDVLVEGGKATAGPPLGPALGPLGLNILQVVEAVNERTASFDGMKVPVKILVSPTEGTFELVVGTPTTSALLLKEGGLEKGSGNPRTDKVGNLTLAQVVRVAQMKADGTLGADLKAKTLEILGSCVSLGVTVEGKEPHDVQAEVKGGLHDRVFKV
ncbi:MAG: 50S ribosomal protein L11 [Thermoplasmata archaeon]